ncbi:histidinol-phosphatase, partial [Streptomyces albiflaviniger]|nr:histidinol-phosphatase [Streptomyces albiflaviniger]
DHGGLISGLDARLSGGGSGESGGRGRAVTLGGTLHVSRGTRVRLDVDIALANGPNWAGFVPKLARVDVIQGEVTGAADDRDTFAAPRTRVVKSYQIGGATDTHTVRLSYDLGPVDRPLYVRLRGTDGNRVAVGARGAAVDPHGPAMDVPGDADPWRDLWFYANPMWVLPS